MPKMAPPFASPRLTGCSWHTYFLGLEPITSNHRIDMDTTPGQKLRALLASPRTEYILEAHSALAAVIAASSGISGLWGSSLTFSASWGMRDANELSMTQVFEVLESMTDRVDIPILFDGDTGYGSFNHFRRLVRGLCRRSVAGVCIEDKIFPKTNSFIASESQRLAPVEQFCGKLKAGKDAQTDDAFVIVARTEALITGLGLDVALERAYKYAEAGADAILVHSKAPTLAEVASFMEHWDGRIPVVCVPTTYYSTPPEAFDAAGISLVIWANHMLRASIQAMQMTAEEVKRTSSVRGIIEKMVSVSRIFELQDSAELAEAEQRYDRMTGHTGIILAASRGDAFGELTANRPKCMLPINGEPVLQKLVRQLRAEGVQDISVVRGHAPEAVAIEGISYYDNERWSESGELGSLRCAREAITDRVLITYGDIVIKRYILRELLSSQAPLTIVVDASGSYKESVGKTVDRVMATAPAPERYDEDERYLLEMSPSLTDDDTHGEWIGMLYAHGHGSRLLAQAIDDVLAREGGELLQMDAVLNRLVRAYEAKIRLLYIRGDWLDIDSVQDFVQDRMI